jgi:acetyltransferase
MKNGMDNRENSRIESLKPFFEAASVAVVGASRTEGKGGYNIIENLAELGYSGTIYPVNPRAREILGLPAYGRLEELPVTPELALVVVPPEQVMPCLESCVAMGIKAVIVESAGFGEMDENGALVEQKIAELARRSGMRIMGPNSVGTINAATHFDSSLGRLSKLFLPGTDIREGRVGFICQTGLVTGVYLPLINTETGISKAACLGNKCDVDESDMLEYLGNDPATGIIAMYLESIKNGRRFLELSRRIVKEKPVIVIKSAVTEGGARASVTHTGSIAGEDRVYETAFRQTGIIRARSFEELWDFLQAFVRVPLPKGNRVGIINLAGSGCVTAVDACARQELRIAELSPETRDTIKRVYPGWWKVRSPVDVWTAIEASGFEETYNTVTQAVMADENVDAVIVITGAIDWMPGRSVAGLFGDIKRQYPEKPLLAVSPLGDREIYNRMCREFQQQGIPSYTGDEAAIAALAALYRYSKYRTAFDTV